MIRDPALVAVALAALLTTPVRAQSAPPPATLHSAWLQELLDCDSAGAAETLSRLSCDTQTPQVERWLATARLLEMRRIGIGTTLPAARSEDVPLQLSSAFTKAATEREDVQGLLQLAVQHDGKLLDAIKANPRRGNFRPLLPDTVRWAIGMTPHIQQNRRELAQQMQVAWRSGDRRKAMEAWLKLRQLGPSQPSLLQREHALQILLRELDNRSSEAERLRLDYFPDWQKPRITNDPATLLANALKRFESLRRDARPEELDALRQLEQQMRTLGEKDESAALHLLDHLPFYAEQLLH